MEDEVKEIAEENEVPVSVATEYFKMIISVPGVGQSSYKVMDCLRVMMENYNRGQKDAEKSLKQALAECFPDLYDEKEINAGYFDQGYDVVDGIEKSSEAEDKYHFYGTRK